MDSSVSPTHGEQEGTAYNGHFACTCYHPLFLFNQFGDLERCALRPGNVHSAHEWRDVLEPVVERYKEREIRLYFCGDAAFASPEIYDYLEAEGILYAIRLAANKVLQENIAHLLKRPVGRPPNDVRRYHASFRYQAGSWTTPRRVVAKVEWQPGELYPRVGFIVTNLSHSADCQRRLKIRPKGGAKDCHLGWWSDLGVRLGVGDAVRGFFGGSGQRSHAELKRSAPAGRPQGGMVYRIGVSLATRALGARCRPGPSDGVPQFSYRHCFCGRGFG